MSQIDGVALLVKIASSSKQRPLGEDMTAAEELVKDFGCLALAIVHAGAFIAHSPGMNIVKYRSLFLSQRQRMLEEYSQLPQLAKLDERSDTVYTTWKLCYDQLKPESRELLWLLAYLHYDGISEDIFRRAAQNMRSKAYPLPFASLESQAQEHVRQYLSSFLDSDGNWDTVKFAGVMGDLASYSLVDFDRMGLTFRLHVLVHDWAKTVVPHTPGLAIECKATVLSLSIDQEEDAESQAFKRQLGLHVTSVLTHNPDVGANHCKYFTEVYSCIGQWTKKAELEEKFLAVFQRELGSNAVETWWAMHELALSCTEIGQLDKALLLHTQVVDAHKRILGEEHPLTLTSMDNLGVTYTHLGRYNEAEQLQLQVLDAYKRILGEEHLHTLTSMNNLASTYSRLGRHNEVEHIQILLLDSHRRILGEEHPYTLVSMNNLALAYSDMGRLNEAEQLQIQVFNTRQRILGKEHLHTLASMSNLALTYSRLGRHSEAEQFQVQVVNSCKRILGEEHPNTLLSMNNLAWSYSYLCQWDEATELFHKAISIAERKLGNQHPDTQLYHRSLELMETWRTDSES
ncbi:unnamed protein product [Rhizoctonia solani]|uniref:Kinesin light chain n=1 Tax=Rhizoctonia solani TaxID=456999 RepID=A0A8H3DR59_9AGAM|nr:unnamed protein product [Rhizoctonia solani]